MKKACSFYIPWSMMGLVRRMVDTPAGDGRQRGQGAKKEDKGIPWSSSPAIEVDGVAGILAGGGE